jgi:alpha-tubulin suppressor-like RCC1 family protein
LGHGNDKDKATPLMISTLKNSRVVSVACGDAHTIILTGTSFPLDTVIGAFL